MIFIIDNNSEKHSSVITLDALSYMKNTAGGHGSIKQAKPDREAYPMGSSELRQSTCPPSLRERKIVGPVYDVLRCRWQWVQIYDGILNNKSTQMLSHSRYITPMKELSGVLGRKGREHLAFKWVHFARLIPAGIYPVIVPGSCKALSLGSFKCFKKPGLIHLYNVPGQQREAWYSQNSKMLKWFSWIYTTQNQVIRDGNLYVLAQHPPTEGLNRPPESLRAFEHESTSLKKGWQIPRTSDPLAEVLWPQEVVKEWLFAYSKARESHISIPKMCSYTRNVFVMCLLSSIRHKNHQVNCSYKIIKQVSILILGLLMSETQFLFQL